MKPRCDQAGNGESTRLRPWSWGFRRYLQLRASVRPGASSVAFIVLLLVTCRLSAAQNPALPTPVPVPPGSGTRTNFPPGWRQSQQRAVPVPGQPPGLPPINIKPGPTTPAAVRPGPATPPVAAKPASPAGLKTNALATAAKPAAAAAKPATGGAGVASRMPQVNERLELIVGLSVLGLGILFLILAKTRPRPLPGWLKWGCRILGGLFILAGLLPSVMAVLALVVFVQLRAWTSPRFGEILAALLGELTGVLLYMGLGVWLFRVTGRKQEAAAKAAESAPTPKVAKLPRSVTRKTAIQSCNILHVGADARRVWQFDARSGGFVLNREQASPAGEPLPGSLVAKDWTSLWQRKLNVAWLPPEQVFLRVAHLPRSDFDETLSMVELQLEKLSPMPVAQVVWSLQILPHSEPNMQTLVVMVAARSAVEEFLGQLEGQGFLADRLEIPMLDQLQATPVNEDGAWIYPAGAGGHNTALVAWWWHGVLQNLGLLALPATERAASLKEQLIQMAWAGELEGWLTSTPQWHLVADAPTTAEWEPALRTGLEQSIHLSAPLAVPELAALTARRAAHAEPRANLLPVEFTLRYHRQFVDRLWMRGLGGVAVLYLVGLVIYGIALGVATFRTRGVEQQVADLAPNYTNAMQLKARYEVLKDRSELKYAALTCYKTVAELLPESATLDSLNFNDGRRLSLTGTAPLDQVNHLYDFDSAIRKAADTSGQQYFVQQGSDYLTWRTVNPTTAGWNSALDLKRVEAQ